jgi:hypothetical protein
MNQDTPSISNVNYTNTTIEPNQLWWGADVGSGVAGQPWQPQDPIQRRIQAHPFSGLGNLGQAIQEIITPTKVMPNTSRRIVQVFIADPNENIPLEESVLWKGDQKLTDSTDTELFFEVPIAEILKAFNEKRVKWTDKEASKRAGKDVFLDPVKIRDLKMVVVTVAQF